MMHDHPPVPSDSRGPPASVELLSRKFAVGHIPPIQSLYSLSTQVTTTSSHLPCSSDTYNRGPLVVCISGGSAERPQISMNINLVLPARPARSDNRPFSIQDPPSPDAS